MEQGRPSSVGQGRWGNLLWAWVRCLGINRQWHQWRHLRGHRNIHDNNNSNSNNNNINNK